MKILITGAFGFIGTNITRELKKYNNYRLIGIDINEPTNHLFDELYLWNKLDKIDWGSIDSIIHLAGKAHDTSNTTDEQSYFDINVKLTKIIFNYFLQSSAKKFIFFSSVKAVADSVRNNILTEESNPEPKTAYGKSKLEAEREISKIFNDWTKEKPSKRIVLNKNSHEGIEYTKEKKVYILRPSMIHGKGNKGNLNLLYKLVSKGIPWPLGSFKNQRSFTSMENLQFIIQQLLEKEIKPGTYQVSDDEPLSTNQLIDMIARAQGKKSRIWKINGKIIRIFAHIGDKLYLPINSERLKKLTESYVVSNVKIKNAMGVEKMLVRAEEGMRKTLSSF